MIGPLIHWAKMWVRYDRKIAGRARSYDVFDYRAGMTRQDLDGQGRPHPAERGDRENHWIDWGSVKSDDDPALWAEAKGWAADPTGSPTTSGERSRCCPDCAREHLAEFDEEPILKEGHLIALGGSG